MDIFSAEEELEEVIVSHTTQGYITNNSIKGRIYLVIF
jgi:hypothetical protein